MRSFTGSVFKQTLGRLFKRSERTRGSSEASEDPSARRRAALAIREHVDAHATLFERAARLREKAERLERAGIPSESARNRAERAGQEAAEGLATLRSSLSASGLREAFDREMERLYPAFKVPDGRA